MTRKTNKVANELNKLGFGKKTISNSRKGNTPNEGQISRCEGGWFKNKLQWASSTTTKNVRKRIL